MNKVIPMICLMATFFITASAQLPASPTAATDSNVGISNPAPLYRLDVQTAVDNDGIRLTGSNPGNLRIRLNNTIAGKEYSFLTGGPASSFGNGNFVITDVSRLDSVRFLINGNTGNIAIGGGTSNPAEMLTVNGMVQMTGMRITHNPGINKIMASDASGAASWQPANALNLISGSGSFNYITKWTPNGFTLGNSQLVDDGTYVGVGNVTPQYKLDLGTAQDNDGLRLRSTNAGNLRLRFNNAGTNKEYSLLLGGTASPFGNGNLAITDVSSGDSVRFLVNSSTGNIGIGSSNPTPPQKLTVNGTVQATGLLIPTNAGINKVLTSDSAGFASWQTAGTGTVAGGGTVNYIPLWTPSGTALGNSLFYDNGTNVGLGTISPAYRLDVVHGGSTGLRVSSTASFSTIDINAASGDAALRFYNAGVNQWNFRNRPADNYLEIFELGGGGSRMVIQDGTGNVGIGETTAPAYKLDVLHGGSTGIRVRSSASFSVLDIDAQTGDASLRLMKAGVNQWNIRNNPANDDLQFFELGGGGERMRIANTTGKVWINGDFTVLGVKAFTMDHPLDPVNKTLVHAAIESNEVINSYSGNVTTDASGKATVNLPDYFEAINKDFRYQLTVVGPFAQAVISKEIKNNQFEIATSQPNLKVSWEVKGVRNDAHMKKHPFVAVEEKADGSKGKYVDPEAYGQPESKRVSYSGAGVSSLDESVPAAKAVKKPEAGAVKKIAGKESTSQ